MKTKQTLDDHSECILAASFKENYNYAKELKAIKSPKANKQYLIAMGMRDEWILLQQSKNQSNVLTR